MSKTTPEEAIALARKHQIDGIWTAPRIRALAALIDEAHASQPPQDERGQGQSKAVRIENIARALTVRLNNLGFTGCHWQSFGDIANEILALSAEPAQPVEAIVSKTASDTEPRLVESFPIEVKIDPNANKGSVNIAASQDSAKESKA